MSFASLDLDVFGRDGRAFRLGERLDRGALGLDAKSLGALLGGRNAKVGDELGALQPLEAPDLPNNKPVRMF